MINETNTTQGPNYTQFSLPPILRNRNEEKDSIEQDPVGDIDNPTPPTETSRHAEKANNSSGDAAHTANGSPDKHLPNKFQAVIYGENGIRAEFTYESMDDVPKWLVNKVFGNYHEAEKLGRTEKDPRKEPQTTINNKYEIIMRDKFETQGQIGAVGSNPHVHDTNFNQLWKQTFSETDLKQLADELPKLNEALNQKAKESEHYRAIAEVVDAEEAAKVGDGPKTLEHLKNAGRWTLGVAEKIGIPLATAALKTSLGL